jgi:hypothetical protein
VRRHEAGSTLITTNGPTQDWGAFLGDIPALSSGMTLRTGKRRCAETLCCFEPVLGLSLSLSLTTFQRKSD